MARKIAWGIDIGQTALRAVKAVPVGDRIEILAFDSVEYDEILSAPDVDKDAVIQQALKTFLSRNRISRSDVALACIPGQSALIRFIKLPPVERKRVPDIVRYEAHQQIPFPLEEVVWDYKPLDKTYGPADQVEVGIFAMRRDIVHSFLSNMLVCGMEPDVLQLAPMALYNYVAFDQPGGAEAQIVIDMGAENTELLIYTGSSVWPRSLPISGNDLTEAIMQRFSVPFGKAEALKRMAKQSKYSTQIYQALEPIFRQLLEQIQRSIGFYKSVNPGVRITGIQVLGGSFKLPGLAKYLSESLHLPVKPLTEPQNFDISMARNPRLFEESALSFGVALGLAVQGCGMGRMDISLLPPELLQRKIIARKKPWAVAVAACALLMFATAWYATWQKHKKLEATIAKKYDDGSTTPPTANDFINQARERKRRWDTLVNVAPIENKLQEVEHLWMGRDFWLKALHKIYEPVPAEPNNEKGVWLVKTVSMSVDYDTMCKIQAEDKLGELPPPLNFHGKGMSFEPGWAEKIRSSGNTGPAIVELGTRTVRGGEVKHDGQFVHVVAIQGETIDPQGGYYVTNSFVKKLTNEWVCPNEKCRYRVPGGSIAPPARCPDCNKTTFADFVLQNPPLLADVRFVGSQPEERFVDLMERQVPLTALDDETAKTWQEIQAREKDQKDGKIKNWAEGDKEGQPPLPRREKFLANLERDRGLRLEKFTLFQVLVIVDPAGTLLVDVENTKKRMAEAAKKGPAK